MKNWLRLLCLCTGLLCLPLSGQTTQPEIPEIQPLPSPEEAAETEPAAENTADLFMATMAMDIRTASYYELYNWCQRLDIDTTGDRHKLQQKLRQYYALPAEPAAPPSEHNEIKIAGANITRYFKLEEIEENYIQLEGDVTVSIAIKEVIHQIKAQRIIVNQEQNILTAEGDIEYTKKSASGTPEIYYSETLSFDLSSTEGIFYDGTGETSQEMKDEGTSREIKFTYKGKKISRLANDTIIIDDAQITTSASLEHPNWRISAPRIWVLAPEEWATRNAVLYIGEIPFLWLPFFFKPGDKLFFNPVLGIRSREGTYLQTTTYLVGEKPESMEVDETLSFIDFSSNDPEAYTTEISGLYLRKVKKKEEDSSTKQENKDDYVKLMLDVYSRLGFFSGIDLKLNNNLTFKGGVAFSRSIWETVLNTPGYPVWENNKPKNYWNRSYFLKTPLPFRYSLEGTFKIQLWKLTMNLDLSTYSDPFFLSDFYSRAESMDPLDLLDQTPVEPEGSTQNLKYTNTIRTTLDLKVLSPGSWLNTMRIKEFNVEYTRAKNTADSTKLEDPYPLVSPERQILVPQKLTFPKIKTEIGGTLLQWPPANTTNTDKNPEKKQEPPVTEGFRSPLPSAETADANKKKEKTDTVISPESPALRKDIGGLASPAQTGNSRFNLAYSLAPAFIMESYYNSLTWNTPEMIDFTDFDYSQWQYDLPINLQYRTGIMGDWLKIDGDLGFNAQKTGYANTTEDYSLKEYLGESMKLKNDFGLTLSPLRQFYDLRDSSFTYTLHWMIFTYKPEFETLSVNQAPTYITEYFQIDQDNITEHNLNTHLILGSTPRALKFDAKIDLPPRDLILTPTLMFWIWELKNTINAGFNKGEEEWLYDPVTYKAELKLANLFEFTGTTTYDITEKEFTDSNAKLKLLWPDYNLELGQTLNFNLTEMMLDESITSFSWHGLKSSLTANRFEYDIFDETIVDWVTPAPVSGASPPDLKPESLLLSYTLNQEKIYFWKNRLNFNIDLNSRLNLNFNRVSDSAFTFKLTLNLEIYKNLSLKFDISSRNERIYRYFPTMVERLAPAVEYTDNIFTDLLKSFNFFNTQDRLDSDFNMQLATLKMVHHLDDWDLSLDFSGSYKLNEEGTAMEWKPTWTISVEWLPVPMIKKKVSYAESEWNLDE